MKPPLSAVLTVALPGIFGAALSLALLLSPQKDTSLSERRPLAQRPAFTLTDALSGRFMQDFDAYAADQFPGREGFRTLKALVGRYALGQQDSNGIYLTCGHAAKIDYPLDTASLSHAAERFSYIYNGIGSGSRYFLAIVPDKGEFLAPTGPWPAPEGAALAETMRRLMPWAEYLDLFALLSADDYYKTDAHWRQEALLPVAAALAQGMGAQLPETAYSQTHLDRPFYGVYYGQAALPMQPDTLTYLTSPLLENSTLYHYETDTSTPGPYNLEKAAGKDPYELFLSGSESLLRLENPAPQTDRELLIFRDSFGSSVAPLLLPGYAAITAADIRYLPAGQVLRLLEQKDRDVLFLYSAAVLNHSQTLK